MPSSTSGPARSAPPAPPPPPGPGVLPAERAAALTAQAQRCADEIARRSNVQQTINAATVSAAAVISGVVLNGGVSPLFLLVFPFFAAVFCNQWLDHHRTICRLGSYVGTDVEPQLRGTLVLPEEEFRFWEEHLRSQQPDVPSWRWQAPVVALYSGLTALVLVLVFHVAVVDPSAEAARGLDSATLSWWPRLVFGLDLVLLLLISLALWKDLLSDD